VAKIKTVSIAATSDEKYKVEVKTGDRIIYVDQPQVFGGTDVGPSPMEYLLTSLAGCIATTTRIMADQKKIKLIGMNMKLEGALDPAIIYGKSKEGRAGLTGIKVTLDIDSDMSKEEKEAFVKEMESRCGVSDNIANATPLIIEVA
jgi:putative redox protein